MGRMAVACLALGLVTAAKSAQAMVVSPEAGADLAARWCADCHVVTPSGAGTDQAPSFAAIARQRTPGEIRASLQKPHARPMRGFTLSAPEIEDVAAYIVSLDERAER